MVMQTAEYRERLVAGGFEEELADAIMGVAVAVRDDAVEEAVARAMDQVAHSAGLLNGRIDRHDEKNERQFQVIELTIREIAAQIRTEIADLGTQTERRLTDLQTQTERRFTDLQTEMGQRLTNLENENERRFSGVQSQIAGLEKENERRFSEVNAKIAKLEGEIAALRAEVEAGYARLHSTIHRAAFGLAGLMIALTGVVVGLLAAGVIG